MKPWSHALDRVMSVSPPTLVRVLTYKEQKRLREIEEQEAQGESF